jgi:hypothetical protein
MARVKYPAAKPAAKMMRMTSSNSIARLFSAKYSYRFFWELGQIAVYALSSHNLCHGPDEMEGGSPAQTSWPTDITAAGASDSPASG